MARKRGVILEVDGRVARVLASGGEFRAIRAPKGLGVGDEVDLEDREPAYDLLPRLALVATLVVLLVFSGASLNALARSFNEVAAYVTVDINPSVELGVNRWGWVISARGLNAEGGELLSGTEYRAFKLADLVSELTRRAAERGYIAAGKPNAVIVAAAPAAPRAQTDALTHELARVKAQAAAAAAPSDPSVAVTTIMASDPALRADAQAVNLSLGKYAVILEARRSGVPVRVSDVERDGLAKAVEAAGGKFRELMVKAEDERDLSALAAQYAGTLKREQDDDKRGEGKGGKDGQDKRDGHDELPGVGPNGAPGPGGSGGASGQVGPAAGQAGTAGGGEAGRGATDANGGGKGAHEGGAGQESATGSPAKGGDSGDKGAPEGNRGAAPGKGGGHPKEAGDDESGSQGRGKGGGPAEADTLAEVIRDGFRELGERIKHQIGKGR